MSLISLAFDYCRFRQNEWQNYTIF